ncbi:hypothetical protein Thexy_2299 [Thermoanaerobacterium xylanolyticum LX-11]|uniref:Uncharacterized protein n=1 Tax=Thermoanaerobacterium xylanolyticum (strain ATCC 49914 / DSM 7097 / LX-11) TaxID=858215 RepID=F6BLV0_THEXL|nr:hypothetical protein [Thermoanaerobacterium xylanolyticum]AEF18301.1 hypothetical protein Thexy_2299 [Thermoanaerobacterium xylanolyticum LX-11]
MVLKRNKLYEVKELIEAIDDVMPELEKEIEDRKKGIPGYGKVNQLEFIKKELEELRKMAVENRLPPKNKRALEYPWYFTDGWKVEPQIERKLWDIARMYGRQLKD